MEEELDYLYGAWHFGMGIYRGMVIDGKSKSVLYMCRPSVRLRKALLKMATNCIKENQLTGLMRIS